MTIDGPISKPLTLKDYKSMIGDPEVHRAISLMIDGPLHPFSWRWFRRLVGGEWYHIKLRYLNRVCWQRNRPTHPWLVIIGVEVHGVEMDPEFFGIKDDQNYSTF